MEKRTFTTKELKKILETRIQQLYGIKYPRKDMSDLLISRRNELRELADALGIELTRQDSYEQ